MYIKTIEYLIIGFFLLYIVKFRNNKKKNRKGNAIATQLSNTILR